MLKSKLISAVSLALVLLLLAACTSRQAGSPSQEQPKSAPAQESSAKTSAESWNARWQMAIQTARKEGNLTVYASNPPSPALADALTDFQKKFGFMPEMVTGRGSDLRNKILQERKAGLFIPDIFIAGLNTVFGAVKPVAALDPLEPVLILPEVTDPKLWYNERLPWADDERLVFTFSLYPSTMLGINKEMVNPDEIKSFYDFLDPKWKGKIIVNDPTTTGTGFNGFSSLIFNKVLDLDYFRQLTKLEPLITRDQRLQVEWLARGKYAVAFWPLTSPMVEFQKIGAPIAGIPVKEGTYLSSGGSNVSLMNKAPHPEAARVFINWLLGKDAQSIIQKSLQSNSARADLSTEGIDPLQIRKPGGKYFIGANSIEKWILQEQDKYFDYAKQAFGPALK